MKLLLMALTLLGLTTMADATDLRVASQQARTDFEAAQAEARESQARILEDKTALTEAMDGLSGRVEQLTTDIADLQRHLEELQAAEIVREEQQTEARLDMREYTGVIRESRPGPGNDSLPISFYCFRSRANEPPGAGLGRQSVSGNGRNYHHR